MRRSALHFAYGDPAWPTLPTIAWTHDGTEVRFTWTAEGQLAERRCDPGTPEERLLRREYHPLFPSLLVGEEAIRPDGWHRLAVERDGTGRPLSGLPDLLAAAGVPAGLADPAPACPTTRTTRMPPRWTLCRGTTATMAWMMVGITPLRPPVVTPVTPVVTVAWTTVAADTGPTVPPLVRDR